MADVVIEKMELLPEDDGALDWETCVECGTREKRASGRIWYNQCWPLGGGPMFGFHCSRCCRRGRVRFWIALALVAAVILTAVVMTHW